MTESAIEKALSLHQSGDLEAAEQSYLDILVDDSRNAEALKLLGVLSCQLSKFDDGISYIEAAIEVDDTVAEYHYALGHSLLSIGRVEDGIKALMRAGELDPSRADAYGSIGDTFQHLQNFPEALNAYQRAAAIEAGNVKYQIGAGLSAVFSGKYELATTYLEKAASESDDIPQVFYGLALVKEAEGDIPGAKELMAKAVALDGENPEYKRIYDQYAAA